MTPILGAVASPCLAISSKLTQSASALEMLALMGAIPMPAGGAELLSSVSSLLFLYALLVEYDFEPHQPYPTEIGPVISASSLVY